MRYKYLFVLVFVIFFIGFVSSATPDCTSGPCCDSSTGTFKPSNFYCEIINAYWQCSSDNIYINSEVKYCSGTSSSCNGYTKILIQQYEDCGSIGCDSNLFFPNLCTCVTYAGFSDPLGRCSTSCFGNGSSPGCAVTYPPLLGNGFYPLVIAIAIVALIYLIYALKKRNNTKNSKKKKQEKI
jgi:hypothetical protein